MCLSFELMAALPDEMRFGTATHGPCSVPFAETSEGRAVLDLFSSRPDLAAAPDGLLCRGLCGDESVVASCAAVAADSVAAGRTVMALCCLGTEGAVEALRGFLAKATERPIRESAAYALIWHFDDSGQDDIRKSLVGKAIVDRITPHLFLARCGCSDSRRFLLSLLQGNPSDEIQSALLRGWACPLIKRQRGTLQLEELLAWLENGSMT